MKTLANTVLTVVITFFISLLLNFILGYFSQPKATSEFGPLIVIEGKIYMAIKFDNLTPEPIDNVEFAIPAYVELSAIISSAPIRIIDIVEFIGENSWKHIQISNFEPNKTTNILIPLRDTKDMGLIQIVNFKRLRIKFLPTTNLQSPLIQSLKYALLPTLIYTIFIAIFGFWDYAQVSEITKKIEKVKEDGRIESEKAEKKSTALQNEMIEKISVFKQEHERIEKKFKEKSDDYQRIKLYLIARLSDYSKELTFWHDTIRKIIYQAEGDDKTATRIINQVTETLRTYGTRGNVDDFDAVKYFAESLMDSKNT